MIESIDLEYYEGLLREIGEIVATGLRRPGGVAQAEREPVAWLDVRTAGLSWQNRIVATNPQFV